MKGVEERLSQYDRRHRQRQRQSTDGPSAFLFNSLVVMVAILLIYSICTGIGWIAGSSMITAIAVAVCLALVGAAIAVG